VLLGIRLEKIPYVIWAPDYCHNSGGSKALHRLVHLLNESGYSAYVTTAGNPDWNEKWVRNPKKDLDPRAIAVYPETAEGNPFGLNNRVRWVLNVPGFLGGEDKYDPGEVIFVWSRVFLDQPEDRVLQVKTLEDELFNTKKLSTKDEDRFWYGKGMKKGITLLPITNGLEEITYDWPATREELAEVLKRTKIFYTYDDRTQLILEALLCGCRVIVLPDDYEIKLEDMESNIHYEKELKHFINVTQDWALSAPKEDCIVMGQNDRGRNTKKRSKKNEE
jgi:hypothetical protein